VPARIETTKAGSVAVLLVILILAALIGSVIGEVIAALALIYLFSLSEALSGLLVSSMTVRLSLLALAGGAGALLIFGVILRKAPVWDEREEAVHRGEEAR
jgi:hypothetical protein